MQDIIDRILISEEQIRERCRELGVEISRDYEGKTPVIVGLLRGSVPFVAELIKHITVDMELDFLAVSTYSGTESTGEFTSYEALKTDIKGRDVLIVDDIADTGLTLTEVFCDFKFKGAASVKIITLLDKPRRNDYSGIKPHYHGFDIPVEYVVGFGLDYKGLYRNLPYVAVLKEEFYNKKK